jgi:hypothetical protein
MNTNSNVDMFLSREGIARAQSLAPSRYQKKRTSKYGTTPHQIRENSRQIETKRTVKEEERRLTKR